VQIKTGEGKSITLAMVICVFAMWGFHVSCACYSDYLSKRDYKSFKHLFEFLNLQDNIFYGTFNQISENYINKDGDIRELTLSRILKDSPSMPKKEDRVKKRVIVIDEVDVFFSKEFFNASYCPVVKI
jgi:preprotein translocase subunit SecA